MDSNEIIESIKEHDFCCIFNCKTRKGVKIKSIFYIVHVATPYNVMDITRDRTTYL